MEKQKSFLPALFIISLLSGCGGGGSASGGNAPAETLNITSLNSEEVVGEVFEASSDAQGAVDDSGGVLSANSVTVTAVTSTDSGVTLASIASRISSFYLSPQDVSSGDFVSAAADDLGICISGDSALSGTEAAPIIDFIACEIFSGVFLDGRMAFGASSSVIDEDNFFIDLDFVSFSISAGGESVTYDGDMQITASYGGSDLELLIEGERLDVVGTGVDDILYDYLYDVNIFFNDDYTIDMSGTLDSAALGGIVSFTTTTPFAGTGAGFPTSGILLITGLTSSTRVEAQGDGVNVLIFVDPEGDGTFQEPFLRMWTEITDESLI